MRTRERDALRGKLERQYKELRGRARLPSDAELLALPETGWSKLACSPVDRALLSAWLRVIAREEQLDFALLHARSRAQREDEREAERYYGFPTGQVAVHVQQLVGALYDLVPYGWNRSARASVLAMLWPATLYQTKTWHEIRDLGAELAGIDETSRGLDTELLPSWLVDLDEPVGSASESALLSPGAPSEAHAEAIARRIALADPAECEALPVAAFQEKRLRAYYEAFGVLGLQRLASSSRPAVALAVCTNFWHLESGPSRWQSFRGFLGRVEELVDFLTGEHDLRSEHFAGGPLAATVDDLSGFVLGATAIERYSLTHEMAYEERCAELGPPTDEAAVTALASAWDDVFGGVPALIGLVNDHLYPELYGCVVESPLWPLPRRARIGRSFVEDDATQLDQQTLAKVFSVGCEALGADGVHQELLRAWLALWLGALRPRESQVDASDLVPFGRGHLQVISREFGKSGRREAYWPACGLEALGLRPDHFVRSSLAYHEPTTCAEEACRIARAAWDERRELQGEPLPEIPDRLAYFVRKAMADVIRWNAGSPWIVTKVLGHDTETSDAAYTQVSRSEFSHLLMDLRARLEPLYVTEQLPSP